MEKSIKKITKKAYNWIRSNDPIQQSDNVIKILALFRLITIIDKDRDEEEIKFIRNFISNNSPIDYRTESLFNCILANSLILDIGSIGQIESALEYSSILYEIKDSSPDSVNGVLLNAVFNDEDQGEICPLDIKVPMFDLDIIKMINSVITQIEMKSKFGTCEVKNDPVFNYKIEAMAIHAIRLYDFELGMRSLRALKYLNCKDSFAIETGLDFIIHQQCTDGSFGDFETAFSEAKNEATGENTILQIKLETAIQVLWTLYELTNDKNNLTSQIFNSHKHFNQLKA